MAKMPKETGMESDLAERNAGKTMGGAAKMGMSTTNDQGRSGIEDKDSSGVENALLLIARTYWTFF